MIDFLKIFKQTNAYRILEGDKKANKVSHAYLFLCSDKKFLREYLTIISKIIMCDEGCPCLSCRDCGLIESGSHSDVIWYPKGDKGIVTDDINGLVEESFIKPIENKKKLFVLLNAETMNVSAQNKLLKTLEEPPKNVHILLGASSEQALLPTIKSRVKKIELLTLSDQIILDALEKECENFDKLKDAVGYGDGSVGKALSLYQDERFENVLSTVKDLLINMKTSREVLVYSVKIEKSKIDVEEFLNVLELVFEDILYIVEDKQDLVKNNISHTIYQGMNGLKRGAILNALDSINQAKVRLKFNANDKMLVEWLLFQILEGKYKWQKL